MQPQRSLHRVLDDLGATLLELVCAPSSSRADPDEIGGVAIHDPVDEPVLPRRALVLGVGVHTPADIAALLTSLAAHAAAGLVVRSPVSVDPSVAAAVEASGVPLLALTRGASWTQLTRCCGRCSPRATWATRARRPWAACRLVTCSPSPTRSPR